MSAKRKPYTAKMLRQFDRLTLGCSSPNQMTRISARLKLKAFAQEHGDAICDQMFAVLKKRDDRKGKSNDTTFDGS